ncbi:putative rhodanese domain-containing dual specificity protein phosphatase [Symbiodinium microadriaticum]|uniref:Putative rhodanese domain-containing dual specificity protein phosphatase n=1 Tax=Symbiodinium microadriaticum TaxID=2951 RepID=A0A1Q9F4B8_SYMMI|nr:putative rhodanese domain-containing dual specificity protein phosphatase [Symbiodinium microadriaticum]
MAADPGNSFYDEIWDTRQEEANEVVEGVYLGSVLASKDAKALERWSITMLENSTQPKVAIPEHESVVRGCNLKPMSELLDVLDDAGVLDRDTRLFLVEALCNAEAEDFADILEPFAPGFVEPCLTALKVPGVLSRSWKALQKEERIEEEKMSPLAVVFLQVLGQGVLEASGLHTVSRCARLCRTARDAAAQGDLWQHHVQHTTALWSLPRPDLVGQETWRQLYLAVLRPRCDGIYVGECGFQRWLRVGHHTDMRKNAAALAAYGGRGGQAEWVSYRRYLRLLPPDAEGGRRVLVLQDPCPRNAAERVLVHGVDFATHCNPAKSGGLPDGAVPSASDADRIRRRICVGTYSFDPKEAMVHVTYDATDGEYRLAFSLRHGGARVTSDCLTWESYELEDRAHAGEIVNFNLGRLPDWKGGGLEDENKDHFPQMNFRPQVQKVYELRRDAKREGRESERAHRWSKCPCLTDRHILVVHPALPTLWPERYKYQRTSLEDAPSSNLLELLPNSLRFVERCMKQKGRLLVHCTRGISRSSSIVIAYLMLAKSKSYDEAKKQVQLKRSVAHPNLGFQVQLQHLESLLNTRSPPRNFEERLRWLGTIVPTGDLTSSTSPFKLLQALDAPIRCWLEEVSVLCEKLLTEPRLARERAPWKPCGLFFEAGSGAASARMRMKYAASLLCMVLLADWCNVWAGITLVVSFSLITGAFTFNWFEMSGAVHTIMQVTMCAEGVLWAVAAGLLTKINMIVNNASLAVVQTIICFGGLFFAVSGLYDGVPGKVISIRYILAPDTNALFADACPYYGITCFMVATSMGLSGVRGLPKNKFVSPFWAVACFFIGAWTIGVIGLWGPTLIGGLVRYEDFEAPTDLYKQKTFAWAWIHIFQVIGAIFLTLGGIIFGLMDNIFSFGSSAQGKKFSDEVSESSSNFA